MFKVFKNSIMKVRKDSILSILFVSIETGFEIFIPLMMSKLIDLGIQKGDDSAVYKYGLIIMGLVVVEAFAGCVCAFFAIRASTNFASSVRETIFTKLQTFAFANIDKFSTGSLVTRSTSDIANIQRSFQMLIRGAIRSLSMITFSLIVSYTLNLKIALIFTAFMPVMGITFFLLARFAMPIFEKMFDALDKLNNIMSENIHGMRAVKTFNREEYEYNKMKSEADNIYNYSVKAETFVSFWAPFVDIFVYGIIICIAWFGAKAIIASGNNPDIGLTTGRLMSLMTYGIQILMSVLMISMIFVMLVISRTSLKRIYEVLITESDIKDPENPVNAVKDGSIEFNNVSFKHAKHGKEYVLTDINLSINNGEMIGILGGTGSGKSSLVNLIPRLYDVNIGEVKVGGIDVRKYSLNSLRKAVGIVLQKNILFSGTIRSNMKFANPNVTDDEIYKALDIACATEFVNLKPERLDAVVEQGGANFSGGQKQRLSIARTILKKPNVLIFDDSTSAVDTKTDAKIRDGLKKLLPETTKLIISQRIITLKECNRIIVMDNGKVIAFDTHENLLKTCDLYKEINDIQGN